MNPSRYVILHHRDRAGEHWDLMIEEPDALATWKLQADPASRDSLPVSGRRIQDHRKHYLTYEGPVRGDRGEVRRVDEGTCTVLDRSESGWRVELRGRRLVGRFRLTRGPDDGWALMAD